MMDLIDRQAAIDAAIFSATEWDEVFIQDLNVRITEAINKIPAAQPEERTNERTETHACDCISRQAAIDSIEKHLRFGDELYPLTDTDKILNHGFEIAASCVYNLPPAQPTLYGYKIEHLAYIARVMEKEGVTADYAVRTFDDISRVLRMIIDEAQERVMEALNERYDLQTGGA